MKVSWQNTGQLLIEPITTATGKRRGGEQPVPSRFLQSPHVSVDRTLQVSIESSLGAERRRGALPVIALEAETSDDDAALVVLRHPSGAITFHPSVDSKNVRRGARSAS